MRHRTVSARVNSARAEASPTLGPLLVELAELRTELGLPREAKVLLDEAARLGNVSGELLDRIDAARLASLSRVGDELRDRGDVDAAIATYETALPLARRLDDIPSKAELAFEVARCHHMAGRPEDAGPWFEEAKRRCDDGEDGDGAAICAWLTGEMLRRVGDVDAARAYYEDAAARFENCGEHLADQLATCLRTLGRVRRVLGDDAGALPLFERSLAISRARGEKAAEAWALLEIAWLKNEAGERFHAFARFLDAEQKFFDVAEKEGQAYAAEGLGEIAYVEDRNEEAIEHLTRSIALYGEADAPDLTGGAFLLRARASHDLHRHEDASRDYASAALLHREAREWRAWLKCRLHSFGERRVLAFGHSVGWLGGEPRRFLPVSPLFFAAFLLLGLALGLVVSAWGAHPGRASLPVAVLVCALVTIRVIRALSR